MKIYERRGALLHSKTAVIDGVWSTVGSTNLDWRSFLHNDEVNAVVLGPEFGAQMQADVRSRPRGLGPHHAGELAAALARRPGEGVGGADLGILAVGPMASLP